MAGARNEIGEDMRVRTANRPSRDARPDMNASLALLGLFDAMGRRAGPVKVARRSRPPRRRGRFVEGPGRLAEGRLRRRADAASFGAATTGDRDAFIPAIRRLPAGT